MAEPCLQRPQTSGRAKQDKQRLRGLAEEAASWTPRRPQLLKAAA